EPTPQKWSITNRKLLYGWDPELLIHLQHAQATTLLEKRLIDQEIWDTYFKFAFVRNPWERAMSDYFWMMKDRKVQGTFLDYLMKKGEFAPYTSMPGRKSYRGDHLLPQHEFIYDKEENLMVDFVGRFENLTQDFKVVCDKLGISTKKLPHLKKNKEKRVHYSQFFTPHEKDLVSQVYYKDIELFNYQFEKN
ncbi:sulfotransferase family 2 domain-containing protein, partial [Fulvivirga kasyanovii]